jgi:hypothetical protein
MPEATSTAQDLGYYLYGVVPAGGSVPGLRGLDDAEVQYVEHGALAAAVSRLALDRPPGRRAELVAHAEVVDALAQAGAVVPVQFGSVLEDDPGRVERLLVEGHERFVGLLERLGGTVQMNLRASYVADTVLAEVVREDAPVRQLSDRTRELPEGTVHPDLVRLGEEVSRALEVKRQDDAAMLLEFVVPLTEDHVVRPSGGLEHLLDVALLVARERVDDLEASLEDLAGEVHERIRLRLVGPVAPYDFVEGPSWA